MPAPPVMDLGSGINTQDTIQKLMELERIPIRRLQQENSLREIHIKAYEEVRTRTRDLADKSRKLYSITGAFSDREVIASDPGSITGQASPSATPGEQQVEVVQLASRHQIHSDPVNVDEELPAGRFRIRAGGKEREIYFKGGTIRRLLEQLKLEGEELFDATGVNTEASQLLISLRSKHSGEQGRLEFTDPDGLLGRLGLVRPGVVATKDQAIGFTRQKLSRLQPEPAAQKTAQEVEYRLLSAGRGVELEGQGTLVLKDDLLQKPGVLTMNLEAIAQAAARAEPDEAKAKDQPKASDQPKAKEPAENAPATGASADAVDPTGAPGTSDTTQSAGTDSPDGPAPGAPQAVRETATVGPAISLKIGDVELQGQQIVRQRVLSEADLPAQKSAEQPEPAGESDTDPVTPEKAAQKAEKPHPRSEAPSADQQNDGGIARFVRIGVGVLYQAPGATVTTSGKEVIHEVEVGQSATTVKIDLATLSGGAPVKGVYFFQPEGGKSRVADLRIQPNAGTEQQLLPVHETADARDAIVKVNGVEVRRGENTGITDVIQGLSLDLNRKTAGPVTVSVKTDIENTTKQIHEWVAAYNELMLFLRENSRTEGEKFVPPAPGEDDRNRPSPAEQQGIFASDSTVRQLIAIIRGTVSRSYPSTSRPAYRVLADVGISTGGIGAKFEEVQYGFLQVDDEKLGQALRSNPEGVRELFASDTNEDAVPDNGVAVEMEQQMRPYNRSSGGLISARINMLKDQITSGKEEIFRKERSIEDKQQNLRERFGRMERAVQQNRAMGDYLKRNVPSQ